MSLRCLLITFLLQRLIDPGAWERKTQKDDSGRSADKLLHENLDCDLESDPDLDRDPGLEPASRVHE